MEQKLVARSDMMPESFDGMMRLAETLLKSGFLPRTITSPAQAIAIILTGKELGIGPMTALQSINVINGKPTVAPALKLALAQQKINGFKMNVIESTVEKATVVISREGEDKAPITFTMKDAAGLGLNSKDNWQKQPAVMLRWRAIDAALRLYAMDATLGLYSPEEMDSDVKIDFETGEVKEDSRPQPRVVTIPKIVSAESPQTQMTISAPLMEQTITAAEIFNPTKVEYVDDVGFPDLPPQDITKEVKIEVAKKAVEKASKPRQQKKPSIRVSPEQIDVLDSYTIKEDLKRMGYHWNAGIGAWSIQFSVPSLEAICRLLELSIEDYAF